MPSTDRDEPGSTLSLEAVQEMAAYGITRVSVDYFCYKDFRYTNLKDAVAQARRQQGKG